MHVYIFAKKASVIVLDHELSYPASIHRMEELYGGKKKERLSFLVHLNRDYVYM